MSLCPCPHPSQLSGVPWKAPRKAGGPTKDVFLSHGVKVFEKWRSRIFYVVLAQNTGNCEYHAEALGVGSQIVFALELGPGGPECLAELSFQHVPPIRPDLLGFDDRTVA
jgi:hypothetical protein